ncbi:MAG: KpsF/GutQ family sugar-phosphate isomerase [Bacteroidota bacterium]
MKNEALIAKTALRSLEIEAATIEGLKASIDDSFLAVVNRIFCCSGRVIVTGIGKSALIAQKIVATLNSTGTPALFMHAADAIHGDLGMVQADDLVLCLSKSGATAEIKVLVPFVRQLGSCLVGMVSNRDSYLARQADYILHTPIDQEADPNNLAPTASTTAQMALGDALAAALLALRGFGAKDFAQFHPGGALGKQLYLRIRDLYPQNERPAVGPDASLRQAILEITSKRLGATAVVDENDGLLGIITDGDLRRMLERGEDTSRLRAAEIMSPQPKTIGPDALAVRGLATLREYSITQLVVADEARYLGMIHLHDLIREGLL